MGKFLKVILSQNSRSKKGIRTVVPRTCSATSISWHLFRAVVSAHIFIDICHTTLVSRQMFRDIYSSDKCSSDWCFATYISRHLFQRQMFRDRYFATLVPAPDISRQIFRDTCYSKFFPLNKFDRQARQRCNFLQQKFCCKKLHRCLACLSNLLRGKNFE